MMNSVPLTGQILLLIHVQRRNISSLGSLILLPALLLTLLFVLQTLVMTITDSPTYRCGCDAHNSSSCGLLHSTPTQAAFCSIATPPIWPAMAQVPSAPQSSILFHGANDLSEALSDHLLQSSRLTSSLIGAWTRLNLSLPSSSFSSFATIDFCSSDFNSTSLKGRFSTLSDSELIQGISNLTQLLSSAQVNLGTPVVTSPSLLIEPSFIPGMSLFGSGSLTSATTLFSPASDQGQSKQSQPIYLLSPNCSLLSQTDNRTLSQLSCALDLFTNISIKCLTMTALRMGSRTEINQELYCGWPGSSSGCSGKVRVEFPSVIYDWGQTSVNPPLLDLTLIVNDSNLGRLYLPPDVQRWISPLNLGLLSFQTQLGLTPLTLSGLKSFPVGASSLTIDLTYILGGIFFLWIFMLPLPSFVHTLTATRMLLRLQRTQGLRLAHHRAACYLIFMLLYGAFVTVFILVGVGIGLSFFIHTDPSVLFITCLIWGHTLIALSFWIEAFLSFLDASSSVLLAVCAVIFSGLASNLIVLSFIQNGPEWAAIVLELIPPFALYRVLYEMSAYALRAETAGGQGLTLESIHEEGNGTIIAWIILSVEAVCMAGCAAWIREVFNGDTWSLSRHPLFFLGRKFKSTLIRTENRELDEEASGSGEPNDVLMERTRVQSLLADGLPSSPPPALILRSLQKVYPNGKVAVHCLDLCIGSQGHETFGLLGPNGCGKTTCLSMIQGLIQPTSGEVIISGCSLSVDSLTCSMSIGVCPQHDVFWPSLTPREHLWVFGRIKGRSNDELGSEIEALIVSIGLSHQHSNLPCSQLSGGMLRRLSVGTALVGRPKLCIVDEPSTGLDPENRRLMWGCIQLAQSNQSMILTTHSMEEAEVLCDRIAIFVGGRIRAIGGVEELKSRYSSSLLLTLSCGVDFDKAMVHALIKDRICEEAKGLDDRGKTMRFQLPRCALRHVLRQLLEMRRVEEGMQGLQWEVTEANLTSVFLSIVRTATEDGEESGRVV